MNQVVGALKVNLHKVLRISEPIDKLPNKEQCVTVSNCDLIQSLVVNT